MRYSERQQFGFDWFLAASMRMGLFFFFLAAIGFWTLAGRLTTWVIG